MSPNTTFFVSVAAFVGLLWVLEQLLTRDTATYERMKLWGLLNVPGVYAHELCHAVAALLCGGAPTRVSVVPRAEGDDAFGSAVQANTLFLGLTEHSTPLPLVPVVSLAPLLLLPAAVSLVSFVGGSGWANAALAFVAAQLIYWSKPSSIDWDNAKEGAVPFSMFCTVLFAGYLALDFIA